MKGKAMKKKTFITVAVIMVIMLFMTSCGNKKNTEDSSLKNIKKAGVLKVGMCPEYPPFESINNSGAIEGFDADLAEAIGKEMGVKVELVNTPWEGLISGLSSGDFDIIMSGMSPEEAKESGGKVNVSNSYFNLDEVILTTNKDIKSKKDLAGKIVGSHAGSASENAVKSLEEQKIKIKKSATYNRHSEALADMLNGNIDAMVVEKSWAKEKAKTNTKLIIVDDPVQTIKIAAVFPKGNDSLTKEFNKALKTVKENGTYDKIYNKWFAAE